MIERYGGAGSASPRLSRASQNSALRSWSSSYPRVPPYNRTLSTAFAAIQPR